jgi:acetyl-CoA carboxylase carboxyl transferase subunit alpha
MKDALDFEKPILAIQEKVAHYKGLRGDDPSHTEALKKLEKKKAALQEEIYAKLTPWQRTQIARHPQRPSASDYIAAMFDGFTELHGDRLFGDDPSIIAGLGRLEGRSVVVIGQEKGKGVKGRMARNFGMPHPEGYRKALRIMQMAERFDKPIITLVDTPGAYPGAGAEERGQAVAIAQNLLVMSQLSVPIVTVVIGEGGSGGALALSVSDRLMMLEYAVYSIISPEGCAAILWNDAAKSPEAAEALKMTAPDLLKLGITDETIPEPLGGAHSDPAKVFETTKKAIFRSLGHLLSIPPPLRLQQRLVRLRRLGAYLDTPSP